MFEHFCKIPQSSRDEKRCQKTFCGNPSSYKHTVSSDDQSIPEEEPIHRVAATVDELGKIKVETWFRPFLFIFLKSPEGWNLDRVEC